MITIDKKLAVWLSRGFGTGKPPQEFTAVIQVSDSRRYGHVAATTNGHVLHVASVSAEIPVGFYNVDKKTGELIPHEKISYPDWETIVPTDAHLVVNCTIPADDQLIQVNDKQAAILADNNVAADIKLLRNAIGKAKSYKILAQQSAYKPIKVDLSTFGNIQFAVIMVLSPDLVRQATAIITNDTDESVMGKSARLLYTESNTKRHWKKGSNFTKELTQANIDNAIAVARQNGWAAIKFVAYEN